jgi:hypothetical protein
VGRKEIADVMELVYVSVLEAEFCEFESHHPHQQLPNGTKFAFADGVQ